MIKMIILVILGLAVQLTACLDRKVNLTISLWKGRNCSENGCSVEGLEFFKNKNFIFGPNDDFCLNLPGTNPLVDDPDNIVWPHSGGLTDAASQFTNWDDKIDNFCNTTANTLNFNAYNGTLCQNFLYAGSMPTGVYIGMNIANGLTTYTYTELIQCSIFLAGSNLSFNLFILLAIIFYLI